MAPDDDALAQDVIQRKRRELVGRFETGRKGPAMIGVPVQIDGKLRPRLSLPADATGLRSSRRRSRIRA